ncbi:hypothetical protein L3i23_12550 [Herbiconiux sp. L3-i23]|jgi:hypothetical protein|nr:hypothetical protein L3i23_12550 [Herbiconiux sp. L3-i23]
MPMSTSAHDGRPEHTEVASPPTVASVAAVASTTEDVEAAEPTHPDRPVGVNVDTAALGTEPGASEPEAAAPQVSDGEFGDPEA